MPELVPEIEDDEYWEQDVADNETGRVEWGQETSISYNLQVSIR